MRTRKLAALALAGAVFLAGCGAPEVPVTPTPEPTPTPTVPAEPLAFVLPCSATGGFHPITGGNRLNLTLAPLMYRGLFALDRAFAPQYDLCERYEVSADGLSWTFWLKEAAFSDGAPLTAAEVKSSLDAARQSSRYGARLGDVVRVTAEEDSAVTVYLFRPNGALPSLLDVPIVKETDDPQRPLGTGPYYLTGEDGALALTAREGAQVPRETIPLQAVGSGDDLVYAFESREISLVDTDLTGTNMPGYSGRQETADYPTTTLLYVGCNTASGVCRDQTVRKALALVFDRETVAGELLLGHAVASALPIHPAAAEYDPQAAGELAYDPGRAAELLTEAGWAADEEGKLTRWRSPLAVKLIVNQENTFKAAVAQALAEALEELGCTVTLSKLPWDDFVSALERGEFDLYLGESVLTADFDLEGLLGTGGELNYGRWRGSDALLDAYRAAAGKERKDAASDLLTQLAEEVPIIPLCFKNGSLLTQWGQVQGTAPTQRDVFAGLDGWQVAGE